MNPVVLSVIIVNYNVRYFLEQVLRAALRASKGMTVELIVVDNNSSDGSVEWLKTAFPSIKLIGNQENVGFSKANNQGIEISKGRYVLLLNPDTVVAEDCFLKCVDYLEKNPKIGGLGVKMVDGSGAFLPESKRGFPSPWVAFCKVFGLSALFPHSKRFNKYYLGHLSAEENNPIEVLAGAFMMMPRRVIDEIGLLDEAFFMYGEDIDWSYRISKAGYENAYFSDTTIVHYKGESTKKGSLNYVKIFYNAMIIFAQKHFRGEKARIYILLMRFAIYFRAILTVVSTAFMRLKIPFLDAFLTAAGLFFLKNVWAKNYFDDPNYFSQRFIYFNIPLYVSVWILSIFLSGGYDLPLSLRRVWRGGVLGTILLAAIYGFLPSDVRFSRAILVLGSVWMLFAVTALRYFIHFLKYKTLKMDNDMPNNIIVIGDVLENERVQKLLSHHWSFRKNMIGLVAPKETTDFKKFLGNVNDLTKICQLYDVKELIFCSADIENKTIIEKMVELRRDTGGG